MLSDEMFCKLFFYRSLSDKTFCFGHGHGYTCRSSEVHELRDELRNHETYPAFYYLIAITAIIIATMAIYSHNTYL